MDLSSQKLTLVDARFMAEVLPNYTTLTILVVPGNIRAHGDKNRYCDEKNAYDGPAFAKYIMARGIKGHLVLTKLDISNNNLTQYRGKREQTEPITHHTTFRVIR